MAGRIPELNRFDSRNISHGIGLADLDRDGDLDVVVNALYVGPLVYRNEAIAPRVMVRLQGKAPNVQAIGAQVRLRNGPVPLQSQEIISGGRYLAGDEPGRVFAVGRATNLILEVRWRSGQLNVWSNVEPNCVYEISERAVSPSALPPSPKSERTSRSDAMLASK